MADASRPMSLFDIVQSVRSRAVKSPTTSKCLEMRHRVEEGQEISMDDFMHDDGGLNTRLLECVLKYSEENNVQLNLKPPAVEDENLIVVREELEAADHSWNRYIGSRYSKRRGCVQLWSWIAIGVVVFVVTAVSLASLSLDDVLHLGAFSGENRKIGNYAFLRVRDEVEFSLSYEIAAESAENEFQVLLMTDEHFENWRNGRPFEYVADALVDRVSVARLDEIVVPNEQEDEYVVVVNPCSIPSAPDVDFCDLTLQPSSRGPGDKIFNEFEGQESDVSMTLASYSINPTPQSCSASGEGLVLLLMFLPWLLVLVFGFRVFPSVFWCESFKIIIEREYVREMNIPEHEVDYWQPPPWDRKVPKTRLLGPCCWKKVRKPFEHFYTWWRHENYFTWIFFPYRNERLSQRERAIIIFCSLYITFYVLFIVTLNQDLFVGGSVFFGVVLVYLMITLLPALANDLQRLSQKQLSHRAGERNSSSHWPYRSPERTVERESLLRLLCASIPEPRRIRQTRSSNRMELALKSSTNRSPSRSHSPSYW